MRLKHLILWNMKFQARYGFYLLYGFLTILYMVLLFSLPQSWKTSASAILIFSDPAAMGLFFMGAIVLLEKSQKVTSAFSVSPMTAFEYITSKVVSLGMIALLVALILAISAKCEALPLVLSGTCLSSILFTLLGMIVATKITSLNQFILATVPVELLTFVPAVLHFSGLSPAVMRIYPANVCMDLVAGRTCSGIGLVLTIALIIFLFTVAHRHILKMWQGEGGIKL